MSDEHFIRGTMRHPLEDSKAIDWFAGRMKMKLMNNLHKAHWSEADDEYLLSRLKGESVELHEELFAKSTCCPEAIIDECADVANFAMMIADNLRNSNAESEASQ